MSKSYIGMQNSNIDLSNIYVSASALGMQNSSLNFSGIYDSASVLGMQNSSLNLSGIYDSASVLGMQNSSLNFSDVSIVFNDDTILEEPDDNHFIDDIEDIDLSDELSQNNITDHEICLSFSYINSSYE